MTDFFSSLVDRAAGRAPVLDRRIAPRFEPPRGRSNTPESISQDSTIQPAIDEIFKETSRLEVPPRARKAIAPTESPRVQQSNVPKSSLKENPAPIRSTRAETKSTEPPRAIAKMEQILEPVAHAAARPPQAKSAVSEAAPERKSTASVAPRESDKPARASTPDSVSPVAKSTNRVAPSSPANSPSAIRPKVTPRAPQVVVQRERSAAATIQVTIGRIEVRAAGPGSSPTTSRSPSGPKLSLEDYLKNRAGGSR
jgi:hypothetical protein